MKKALVAYASWTGSTKEIAERIAKVLTDHAFNTEIITANNKISLEEYDLIIAGTSIHAGQTISSFRKFLHRNSNIISTKPLALFVSCANMMNDNEKTRIETMDWLKKAIAPFPSIQPISIGLFAGAALSEGQEYEKQNFIVKKIVAAMQKSILSEYGKSDFRDWEIIETWTKEIINNVDLD